MRINVWKTFALAASKKLEWNKGTSDKVGGIIFHSSVIAEKATEGYTLLFMKEIKPRRKDCNARSNGEQNNC